jgi:NAD-dependent DNA ligase
MKKAPKEVIERLEKLREAIEKYRYEYHVLDKASISEEALDSLKHELVQIETEYPELITPDSPSQRVAGKPLPEFTKVVHKVPQWSFNDAFSPDEMREFRCPSKAFPRTGWNHKKSDICGGAQDRRTQSRLGIQKWISLKTLQHEEMEK